MSIFYIYSWTAIMTFDLQLAFDLHIYSFHIHCPFKDVLKCVFCTHRKSCFFFRKRWILIFCCLIHAETLFTPQYFYTHPKNKFQTIYHYLEIDHIPLPYIQKQSPLVASRVEQNNFFFCILTRLLILTKWVKMRALQKGARCTH